MVAVRDRVRMIRPHECETARRAVSLRLDGELSEIGEARLAAHLRTCPSCCAFYAAAGAMIAELRAAPLERLERSIVLPPRRTRLVLRPALAVAASLLVIVGAGQALVGGRDVSADDLLRERALQAVAQSWSVQRDLEAMPGRQPGEIASERDESKRGSSNAIAI